MLNRKSGKITTNREGSNSPVLPEQNMKEDKKIIVTGANGKMGRETVKTIHSEPGMKLVGAVGRKDMIGEDIISLLGLEGPPLEITSNLEEAIERTEADTLIEFSVPGAAMKNITIALERGLHVIVGTTGLKEEEIKQLEKLTAEVPGNLILAPNFSLGANLMLKFASLAASYFKRAEIIEMHQDKKEDAPSGTALKTAQLLAPICKGKKEKRNSQPARGEDYQGISIHSVRLPGMVAHQEVIFGEEGQVLTLRHDTYDRSSFMPGLLLALDKINEIDNMVYGLENLISLSEE